MDPALASRLRCGASSSSGSTSSARRHRPQQHHHHRAAAANDALFGHRRWRPRVHAAAKPPPRAGADPLEPPATTPTISESGPAAAAAAASRRGLLTAAGGGTVLSAAAAAIIGTPAALAVQTLTLPDGSVVDAYEHGMSLSIVALRGSVPTQWVLDFRRCLGRYAGFELGQRGQISEIFAELADPKAKRSAGAADVATLGDAWLAPAIRRGLVRPIDAAEAARWHRRLPRRWRALVARTPDGGLPSAAAGSGSGGGGGSGTAAAAVYGCPYRWGATLVAYRKDALLRRGGRAVRDWADLLQPALRGRVAFTESSREFVGIALKTLAAESRAPLGFNADAASLAAAGVSRADARARVRELLRAARAFSDRDHGRALAAGDALAIVGTSEDLVPLAERTPALELVCPLSGTALWADLWVVPAGASGGHMRSGPSPLLPSWLEFSTSPARVATLGSLRTGATPLLLPSPPAPLRRRSGSSSSNGSADGRDHQRRGGLLGWLIDARRRGHRRRRDGGSGDGSGDGDGERPRRGGGGHSSSATATATAAAAAPPALLTPDDAVLSAAGARGLLPPDAVLGRSEFLLPLTDAQRELYAWLLGRE